MSAQCGATTRSGGRCKRAPILGATRCRLHGGASPQARRAAQVRVVEAKAARMVPSYEPMSDPVTALLQLAAEVVGFKDWLGGRLAELRDDQWVSQTRLGAEQISAWTAAYERALDRTGRLLVDIGRLNLEERQVQISQRSAEMLAQAVMAAMATCHLSDRLDLRAAIADELRQAAALESRPSGGSR